MMSNIVATNDAQSSIALGPRNASEALEQLHSRSMREDMKCIVVDCTVADRVPCIVQRRVSTSSGSFSVNFISRFPLARAN
jgi:sorbitol-specific phosphotransferase system component IIBC